MISAVKLEDYQCGKCPAALRRNRGCEGGGPLYRLGRVETRTCPRREVLRRPYLSALFEIYNPDSPVDLDKTASPCAEALSVISQAQAWRAENE